jgi:hypothetical protein
VGGGGEMGRGGGWTNDAGNPVGDPVCILQ